MARRSGLRTRLARLERRKKVRAFPRVVFGIYDHADADITGVEADGVTVPRLSGETISELHRRAFVMTGALNAASLYSTARAASERKSEPPTYPTRTDQPERTPRAVPGVGREASRDELIRMGVIAVPAERLDQG